MEKWRSGAANRELQNTKNFRDIMALCKARGLL
jgi:hypothetical protein